MIRGDSAVVADRKWMDALVCPGCRRPLRRRDDHLSCEVCTHSWPIIDEVPHFVEDFQYWGEIPQQKMQAVNRRAEKGSWRAALTGSDDPDVQRASEMILNVDRANWRLLLDLPPNCRALDLGAGTGTNSHGLSAQCGEVIALEPVAERIDFMRRRFAQEGLGNVKPLRSSLWTLPFADNSFDLVAMNGVLEWVAAGQSGDPRQVQERALANIYRLLRDSGCFYLGIENRYSLGYFLGYPDPHCGLPWVTILPRPCAQWYARRAGQKEGYRNYLYSSGGYRKLLRAAGFRRIEIYLALPTYNQPRFLIPLAGRVPDYYFRNFTSASKDWRKRLGMEVLRLSGLRKYLEYSFAIIAYK